GAYQVFVLPGEAAEQNRGVRTLFRGEGALDRTMKMLRLIESGKLAQTDALGFYALLDFGIGVNLDEIRRHVVLRRWTAGIGFEGIGPSNSKIQKTLLEKRGKAHGNNSGLLQAFWIKASETPNWLGGPKSYTAELNDGSSGGAGFSNWTNVL